ncbi:Caspase-1 [Oryzias melastigma]|nr:Caspase-1 [Oryzias melastigma]
MNLQAGGPLFIIESPQGSVNQLQLPHCQPEPRIEEQERQQSFFSAQNLREIRPKFIENVSDPTLKKLLLKLRQCEVITSNEEEKVRAPELKSERARILFDTVKNKGEKASSILMKSLQEEDEFCFDNLMLGIDQ